MGRISLGFVIYGLDLSVFHHYTLYPILYPPFEGNYADYTAEMKHDPETRGSA